MLIKAGGVLKTSSSRIEGLALLLLPLFPRGLLIVGECFAADGRREDIDGVLNVVDGVRKKRLGVTGLEEGSELFASRRRLIESGERPSLFSGLPVGVDESLRMDEDVRFFGSCRCLRIERESRSSLFSA